MPEGELKAGISSKDLLCEHKDSGASHFALGLCEACYKDVSTFFIVKMVSFRSHFAFWHWLLNRLICSQFDKLSGGLGGGLDPPAFQRAEREREKRALLEESVDEVCDVSFPWLGIVCGSLLFIHRFSF